MQTRSGGACVLMMFASLTPFSSFPLQVPVQPGSFHPFSLQPVCVKPLEKITWVWIPVGRVQRPIFTKNRFVFPLFPCLSHEPCYQETASCHCSICPFVKRWPDGSEYLCVSAFSLQVGGGEQNQNSWARADLAPTAFLRCSFL